MVEANDDAPDFTVPVANGEVETFTLSAALPDAAPIVLAFFPGAFTSVCSHEMSEFDDRLSSIQEAGGTLYGVSVDLPFALNEFREDLSLSFDLLSDTEKELIYAYGVGTAFADVNVHNLAQRAVFVIDESGTVTYAWVADNAGIEPDYDEVEAQVREAAGD